MTPLHILRDPNGVIVGASVVSALRAVVEARLHGRLTDYGAYTALIFEAGERAQSTDRTEGYTFGVVEIP